MNVAIGFKSHSGWAAAVTLGVADGHFRVLDRRRIELVDEGQEWAKQPYHAADGRPREEARRLIKQGRDAANRRAEKRIKEIAARCRRSDENIVGCGIVVPEPMPAWTADEILAVHIRMHKAEGLLFPTALLHAAESQRLNVSAFPEKQIAELAAHQIGEPGVEELLGSGKSIGPPWGKDQKLAALAAAIAFKLGGINRR